MANLITTVQRLVGTTAEMEDTTGGAGSSLTEFENIETGQVYQWINGAWQPTQLTRIFDKIVRGTQVTAFEQVTVDDTAAGIGLTAETYGSATNALITVDTADIRYRLDGEAPTATSGHLVKSGETLTLQSAADIANFKAIRTTTTSAVLSVSYSV
jgi:hypothetical protein